MASAHQMLVRALEGNTVCVQFQSDSITGALLKQRLEQVFRIPASCLRVVTGRHDVQDSSLLSTDKSGQYPSCSLLLRLRGGKGGFGSLLRGAASKAGQKKTKNFDACRDMNGRRLRHVNAEKKLKEWKEEETERSLEKVGEDYIKKLSKDQKVMKKMAVHDAIKDEVETGVEDFSATAIGNVNDAVRIGLVEAKKLQEQKKRKSEIESSERKKIKILSLLEGVGIDDDEESGESDDESQEGDETEAAIAGKQEPSSDVSGPSTVPGDDINTGNVSDEASDEVRNVEVEKDSKQSDLVAGNSESQGTVQIVEEEINLDLIDASSDLEKYGLDRLKTELQKRGLKCGGSLAERAARLFLLKHLPLEKLDRKHLAKPNGKKA